MHENTKNKYELKYMFSFGLPLLILISIALEFANTDAFLPALSIIEKIYNASPLAVEALISINLIGLAISSIIYGPISDHFGRRSVYLFGNLLFCFASFVCYFVNNFETLLVMRFVQGLGGGVCATVGLAILKDYYDEKEYVKILSWIGVVLSASPVIFPLIGSQLLFWGWQVIFLAIAVCSFCMTFFIWKKLPETLVEKPNKPFSFYVFTHGYVTALKNKKFVFYALMCGLCYAAIWVYLVDFALLYTNVFHFSPQTYGWYLLINVAAAGIGAWIQTYLINIFSCKQLLWFGVVMLLLGAVGLFICSLLTPQNILIIAITISFYWFGTPFIFSNASEFALAEVPETYGAASSLLLSAELLCGGLAVWSLGQLYSGSLLGLSIVILICALFIFFFASITVLIKEPLLSNK